MSERSHKGTPIELRLNTISQLFHSLDPYPFRERDLDRDAEEFIFEWTRELPHKQALEIIVHLPQDENNRESTGHIRNAMYSYFGYRARILTRDLQELFVLGRVSLSIGLVLLAACIFGSSLAMPTRGDAGPGRAISEGLLILG